MVSQVSIPAPRTWSANDLVTVPRLRADAVDAIALLRARPLFVGQATTGPSWASGADNSLGMDAELVDSWDGHVTQTVGSALSSQYWAPLPGWYLCRAVVPFGYTSATQFLFAAGFAGVNNGGPFAVTRGALLLNGSTRALAAQVTDLVPQTLTSAPGGGGDWIQATAIQNTGSPVVLVSNATELPTVTVRWVAALSGTQPLPVPPNSAVPSPITAAWLNANVRDAANFLCYPPVCKVGYNAGGSLPSQSFPAGTLIPFGNVVVDNYGGWSTGSNAYTAPVSGSYYCYAQFNLAANANATGYCCGLAVNGGTIAWGGVVLKQSDTFGGGASITRRLRLGAGDTVQAFACQGSGGSIAYNASSTNPGRVIVVWDGS